MTAPQLEGATPELRTALREWAKNVVRSVAAVHINNTDAVPTFKRRPDQCIDRAAVLLAIEHADLADVEDVLAAPSRPVEREEPK